MLSKKQRRKVTRFLWPLFSLLWSLPSAAYSKDLFSDVYDEPIQESVGRYWPDFPDWRWLKAQFEQESKLDPGICSNVGACGIAQFMPGTWGEAVRALRYPAGSSRFDARLSIDAGAWYQGKMRRGWGASDRTGISRNDLGLASYNAGIGSILLAQKRCANARAWEQIAPCLGQVTGDDFAKQTTGYVSMIHKWRSLMED